MEKKPFSILILILFLSCALSQTVINMDYLQSEYSGSGDKYFEINFQDYSNTPNYIHFIIKPSNGRPSALFSFSDSSCIKDRTQMSLHPYENLDLFIKKDEIRYEKKGYLCIQCIKDSFCSYSIEVKKEEMANLEFGKHFRYNVNGGNTHMTFKFNVKSGSAILDGTKLQMWVKGEKIQATDMYPIKIRDVEFDHGKAFYGIYDSTTSYILTVVSGEGDYIAIGSNFVQDGISKEEIKINDIETIGNLNKGLSQICYKTKYNEALGDDNKFYFDGIIFKNKIKVFFKSKNEELSPEIITDGILNKVINFEEIRKYEHICFSYVDPKEKREEIIFSFNFIHYKSDIYGQIIFSPQIPGYIYRHSLAVGEIAIFQGMITNKESSEINYNMKSVMGYPDMRFIKCNNFPNCKYSDSSSENPEQTTSMTVKSFYLKDEQNITTISAFQPLLVVKCENGEQSSNDKICKFETSIFTNKDRLIIEENDAYSQYLLEHETDLYSIDFMTEDEKDIIYLDLIIFTGDVNLEIESNVKANKYYLSNKIFYSIHIKESSLRKKMINFKVKAYKNSFYIIQYQIVKLGTEESLVNYIESNINYLESVSIGEYGNFTKYIEFQNTKQNIGDSFLLNFYSLNCKFYVFRNMTDGDVDEVNMIDNYGQDIIKYDENKSKTKLRYKLVVNEVDVSEYNKQSCMLYVSGFEYNRNSRKVYGAVSINENVPHFFNFTSEYPQIVYVFHLSDRDNIVVINFNLIDKAKFNIKTRVGNNMNREKEQTIYRNSQLFLDKKFLEQCEEDEVCQIYITITMAEQKSFKRMETTISNIKGGPIYLPKNVMTQDILLNDISKNYYFDIGKSEYGDIKIDYKRGSGNIFVSIVNKTNVPESSDKNWRGMYNFPNNLYDSLRYETLLRKIIIYEEDTEKCEKGCYVLIQIQSKSSNFLPPEKDEKDISFNRISITPRIIPTSIESIEEIPPVKINVNEFIIGNIVKSQEDIYEFYTVSLPYDSDVLSIDWQADGCYLYLRFDSGKPKISGEEKEYDFEFIDFGYKTVYKLTKNEIREKLEKRDIHINSLKYLFLTIGIYTKKIDSVFTSMYAFRISMPLLSVDTTDIRSKMASNILHIRSDQKVQCRPESDNNKFDCLFAVIFDSGDINKSLLAYIKGDNENIKLNYYANIVDSENIERNNIEGIKSLIPYDDGTYSSNKGPNYIYIDKIEKGKCLLIHTSTEMDINVEVVTSIIGNEQYINPNPSTPQIFGVNLQEGKYYLKFGFETTKNLLINIAGINGKGYFQWDENYDPNEDIIESKKKYMIFGNNDRLTLTSYTSKEENKLTFLTAYANDFSFSKTGETRFIFYMTFYPRAEKLNLDQVKEGRSTEFNYREVKFPLNYYSSLSGDYIAVSFNFYKLFSDTQNMISSDKPILTIWGKIVDSDLIASSRMKSISQIDNTNAIYGVFDGAFGSLELNKNDIEKFKIEDPEKKRFFFCVEINKDIILDINSASIEVSVIKELQPADYQLFASEHVYYNGKLENENDNNIYRYKLSTNDDNPYMAIEFASNGKYVDYVFGPSREPDKNKHFRPEELEIVKKNGKTLISFKINPKDLEEKNTLYFIVIILNDVKVSSKLCHYIFKYMTSKTKNYFNFFVLDNDKVNYEIIQGVEDKTENYKLSFKPSMFSETNYYIKLVYKDTLIKEEEKDTISVTESPGKYIEIDRPTVDSNKDITLLINGVNRPVAYIKVLAKMNLFSFNEYVLYEPVLVGEDDDEPYGEIFELEEIEDLQFLYYNKEKRQVIGNLKKAKKIQKYELKFNNQEEMPNYIQVIAETNTNHTQVLYFSPTDPNGKENRLQLGQENAGKNVTMWIKREQFNSSHLYTTVECQEESCEYRILFSGYKTMQFSHTCFTYNYYVSDNNTEVKLRISNDYKIFEMFGEVLTIYAQGVKGVEIDLKGCTNQTCDKNDFIGGSSILSDLPKQNYFDVTIKAKKGDYISIGSKVTLKVGLSFTNDLIPNSYPMSGYLKRGILDQECYKIPATNTDYYLSIILYLAKGGIYYVDENLEEIENSRQLITDGYYTKIYKASSSDKIICVYIPDDDEKYTFNDFSYSIQLTDPKEIRQKGLTNIFSPQNPELIYQRIIPSRTTVFFNAIEDKILNSETIYNMFSVSGIPKMYMCKCKTYPLCEGFDYDNIDKAQDCNLINEINNMNSYHVINPNITSVISPEQNIMVVKCTDLKEHGINYCEFQTSIFGNNNIIYLIENQPFSQYLHKNENKELVINFDGRKQVKRIFVDTLVVSGDISFEFYNFYTKEELDEHKFYVGNKIFYSITISNDIQMSILMINIKAKLNSYYIIDYKIVTSDSDQFINMIYSGANYLVPIPVESNTKEIYMKNKFILKNSQYLFSFQSLNCRIRVKQVIDEDNYEEIKTYGSFSQKVFKNNGESLESQIHTFIVEANEVENNYYEKQFCLIYASGLEITDNVGEEKDLLLGEAVPQKVKFSDTFRKIRYVYPLMNNTKNAAIDLKMNSHALFNLTIFVNGKKHENQLFSRDIIYFIDYNTLSGKCFDEEICHISILIEFKESYEPNVFPILETMIRQTRNVPYYIPKDIAKRDFVSGNVKLYLYTDIGESTSGYITCNFDRGSGKIYAKIVPIGEISNNTEPDWRNYTFPKNISESLRYNFNEKKITFDLFDTMKCSKGCYLLITLQNSVVSSFSEESRLYHLTLTVHVDKYKDEYFEGRSIQIEPEQYIIGSFNDFEKIESREMYDYYEIIIPYDVDYIEIDWQATTPLMFINKGTTKPKKNSHDYKFKPSRGDTIHRLSKDRNSVSSWSNQIFTIGIYTEDIETIFGTKYSFKFHLNKKLNIHKVSQDQKSLCNPERDENGDYNCLFMITYEYLQFFSDVMLYARSQSISSNIKMYGKFVTKTDYEKQNDEELKKLIPTKDNTDFNKKESRDFIFATLGKEHNNLFINVISSEKQIIEMMSSFNVFDEGLTPNPTGCQVFSLSESHEKIKLSIPTRNGLFINFVSIYGSGKIKLLNDEKTIYNIRGRDDRLSIAVPTSQQSIVEFEIINVNFNSTKFTELQDESDKEYPGFAFYMEYNLRGYSNVNYDEISFGKTSEISYINSGFPFYYYAKLNKLNSNIYAFFTFHDYEYNNTQDLSREIRTDEYNIESMIVEQKKIYPGILDYQKIPQPHQIFKLDFYDPAISTGLVNYNKFSNNYIKEEDFPTFLFSIKQVNNGTDRIEYNKIRTEMTLATENDDSITTEKMYQYGIIIPNQIKYYKLKVDQTEGYMRIVFSPGTKYIDFAISDKINSTKNFTNFEQQYWKNGKYIITFKKPQKEFIYLNIFTKEKSPREIILLLNSYAFKYINAPNNKEFKEYTTKNGKRSIEINSDKKKGTNLLSYVAAEFSPINLPKGENTSVIYTLKIVEELLNELEGEIFDSIALKSYIGVVKRENKEIKENIMSIKINNVNKGFHYAQVIAQIRDGPIIEYYSYEPFFNPETKNKQIKPDNPSKDDDEKEKKGPEEETAVYVVVVISVILLVIVIILIIIIMTFSSKNRNTMADVLKISFITENKSEESNQNNNTNSINDSNEDANSNLLMDPKNELE